MDIHCIGKGIANYNNKEQTDFQFYEVVPMSRTINKKGINFSN